MSEAVGQVEAEDGVLAIKRIAVRLQLKADAEHQETARRVFGFFADRCPVYKTLKPAIEFELALDFV